MRQYATGRDVVIGHVLAAMVLAVVLIVALSR